MQPVGAGVLITAADARCRRGRKSEKEIGKRVAAELAGVGECAACVIGLLRPKLQVEVVAAKFEAVRPAVDGEIIVELHVLVVAEHKRGGIAHRAVKPSGRDLKE